MSNLERFGKPLSREEMRNVNAGKFAPAACGCSCGGGKVGSWTYTNGAQPSNAYLHSDINTYCGSSGGSCSSCTNWVS